MSLLQTITDFLETIFKANSPEVQKKQKLKKLDAELKALPSGIYKNGLLQPNFAEAIRLLYVNTKPIGTILENTIAGQDIKRNNRYEFQLIVSCYTPEMQEMLSSLDFETRKQEIVIAELEGIKAQKTIDAHRRKLDKLVQTLNTKEFLKLNDLFAKLRQLSDLCSFNYATALQAFDNKFEPLDQAAKPSFTALPVNAMANFFQDMYFIIANYKMNMSVANAVIALGQLFDQDSMTSQKQKEIISNLRVIESICHTVFAPDTIKKFIRLVKQDPDFEPQHSNHTSDIRRAFAQHLQEQFAANDTRIKGELNDERIQSELSSLFGDASLMQIQGYNDELNELLLDNGSQALTWMTPLKILKTFVKFYYPESVKALLNDIVIEGFFNNPTSKSNFSSTVFTANEVEEKLEAFEHSFDKGGTNDEAVLRGYIRDSHRDSDFIRKLSSQISSINAEAKSLIQNQVTALHSLYVELGDIIQDSKKPSCELISNLKVLLGSTRNRDNTDLLERQYEKWKMLFDIMKNYAIITGIDKN